MMSNNDIREYLVCINGGSGVILQPMDPLHTYILTANHVFSDIQQGYQRQVSIHYFNNENNGFIALDPFPLTENINYFPYTGEEADIDIAILKISRIKSPGNLIMKEINFKDHKDYILCGFPKLRRNSGRVPGLNWMRHDIDVTLIMDKPSMRVEADISKNQTHEELEGSSGGGIFRIMGENLLLLGIQSEVVNRTESLGRVEFTPINVFSYIIENSKGQLEEILPYYMKCFSFLKDEAFTLEINAFDEEKIVPVRNYLKNKISAVIKSGVTPNEIKVFFEKRLLVVEGETDILFTRNIWIVWLEFLTILNIVEYQKFDAREMDEIFNNFRLLYSNSEKHWTNLLKNDLSYSDYRGLKSGSNIFIGTRHKPAADKLFIKRGTIRKDIGRVYEKDKFKTDSDFDPYSHFSFVHCSYLQQTCIIEKLEKYTGITDEEQLLALLKIEYNEIFNSQGKLSDPV